MARQKQKTQDVSRKEAAFFIERMLELAMQHDEIESREDIERLRDDFLRSVRELGLEIPRRCHGEAHNNPNIDHCMSCMPRWGIVMTTVKVK